MTDIQVHVAGDLHMTVNEGAPQVILNRLDIVTDRLDHITQQGDQIMATEAELDAAIANLGTSLTAALARIQAKLDAAGNPVDLSDEITSIQSASDTLNSFLPNTDDGPPADA